jgi:creatinine amidohydrolase
MNRKIPRRTFLTSAAVTAGGAGLAAQDALTGGEATETNNVSEVRLEHLRPAEIEAAMERCPTLFQPLGTIEWHGLHNNVGVDVLKAHALCVGAARQSGGLVAPPLYGGMGGLDQPHTFVMEPENSLFSTLVRPWIETLCREAVRQGFRAIILLTGHYGAAQQIIVREAAVRMTRILGVPILGTPEYILALDESYGGDHAAWGETSLMMHLYPESVDLSRLGDPPHQGVGGRDPKEFASAKDGRRLAEVISGRLAILAEKMPTWDAETIERFALAEGALVHTQQTKAGQNENRNPWAAWRKLPQGVLDNYAQCLVDEKFEEIQEMATQL